MAETRSERPKRRVLTTRVQDVRRLTPHLIRVVVGGDDLDGFPAGAFTDHYVKLQIPPPGAPYEAPFDAEDVKARLPREQ
jgi:NADPH-dependent ferric siderophore reductase